MTKLKTYNFKFYGKTYKLIPVIAHYECNNALAIELYEKSGEDFATLTVNLPYAFKPVAYDNFDYAFIDVNAFDKFYLCEWVEENLGEFANTSAISGFVSYPLFKFDLTKLNTQEEVEKYFMEKEARRHEKVLG